MYLIYIEEWYGLKKKPPPRSYLHLNSFYFTPISQEVHYYTYNIWLPYKDQPSDVSTLDYLFYMILFKIKKLKLKSFKAFIRNRTGCQIVDCLFYGLQNLDTWINQSWFATHSHKIGLCNIHLLHLNMDMIPANKSIPTKNKINISLKSLSPF